MKKQDSKKVDKNIKASKKQVKGSLYLFSKGLAVVRAWVLPPVSLVLLAGLAVKGAMQYLPNLNENAAMVASVFVVVMLLVFTIDKE